MIRMRSSRAKVVKYPSSLNVKMEDADPAEAWGVERYLSEEQSGKLSWILNKGLSVGKKILMTGFVISSAPLVLPPLVVISVIGFACSVPSGLLLASYACTDKLMSKLLPGTKPPRFLLDYRTVSTDEEFENEENEGDYYAGLKGDIDHTGKEEEEMLQDKVHQEKAIVGDENVQEGVGKDEHELIKDVNEIVKENVYQQDEMEEEPAVQIEMKIEGVSEEEMKEPGVIEENRDEPVVELNAIVVDLAVDEISEGTVQKGEFEVTDIVVELCQNTDDIEEDEELARETRGLLERIREEGTDTREEAKQNLEKLPGDAEEGDQKGDRNAEEFGIPFEDRKDYGNITMENPQRATRHEIKENNNEKIPKESLEMKETGYVHNVDIMPEEKKPIEPVEGLLAKREADASLEAQNVGKTAEEEQEPKGEKPALLQGGRKHDNVVQDYQLERPKDIVISTNADAREIADESGFDLYDNKTDVSQQYSSTKKDKHGENMKSSSYAGFVTTDNKKVPVSARQRETNRTAGISSKEDRSMASNEVWSSTEKKIWQQIDAMRKIMGYKAAKHATCFEELKALYLFTGVEPPAPFKDPSDLQEMNDKLRFLMSIVGVK